MQAACRARPEFENCVTSSTNSDLAMKGKDVQQNIELGQQIAMTQGKQLYLQVLARAIESSLDWDKFDDEDGKADLIAAIIAVFHGYNSAGGEVDFAEMITDEERNRRTWERVLQVQAQIKREWRDNRLERTERPLRLHEPRIRLINPDR